VEDAMAVTVTAIMAVGGLITVREVIAETVTAILTIAA